MATDLSPRGLDSSTGSKGGFDGGNSTRGAMVDPASFLRVALDPQLRRLTPAHWAYEWVNAIVAGDADFVDLKVKSAAMKFDVSFLTEPLSGTSGQTLLHVAALMNRPAIIDSLMTAVDRGLATQATEQKTSIRHESVTNKGDVDPAKQRRDLARELDKIDRIFHIKCEQQYLTLVSTVDSASRSVLHYAASARGVMVTAVLEYKKDRFRKPTTSDHCPPCVPLFPEDGHVSPTTGDLWRPTYFEFPEDHPEQVAPDGYVAVRDLLKARNDPLFVDAKDVNSATSLHYATVANDVRGIRALLSFGAEAFLPTKQGATPLELADNKAVRNALVPMENALQLSVGLKIMRPGMRMPAGTSTVDFARTATQAARDRAGPRGVVDFDDGATTAAQRRTAAENALVFLVNTGEDINGRTGAKLQAPLHVACERGNVDVAQLLLSNGAVVDVVDVNGCTPLHIAAELGTERYMALVQLLFDNGADVNATSSTRRSPLHMAATGGPSFKPGHKLVPKEPKYDDAGNVVEGSEEKEEPPGGLGDGNSTMITLLAKLGANMEGKDAEGNSALLTAAKRGNHLAVQTLLTLGARIYAVNIHGHTALHTAAFAHELGVVRQLVRWDAEIGKLKFMLDTSGRSAYDMAADPSTREALHTLYESAASGQLDLTQSVQRQARLLPPTATAPWLPVRVWETTRLMRRTALHCAITGAAKTMAVFRRDFFESAGSKGRGGAPLGAGKANKVAEALSSAIRQRHEREEHVDPAKGTGLPPHRIAPSAARIVAGVGLRFVAVPPAPLSPMPAQEYMNWAGNFADVVLTFPELRDSTAVAQWVDRYAFVPKPNVHVAFINKALLGDVTRSEAAAMRVVPGNELTSTTTEKDFGRVVDFLLRTGVEANAGDVDGVTALMLAVKHGLLFIIRKLLTRGADPNLTDSMGNTAMHYAHAYKQSTAGQILTEFTSDGEAGGSILDNVPNAEGKSPAECAGAGIGIFPDSAERLVNVPRVPKRSESLHITQAL